MAHISLEVVSKSFGGVAAVKALDLEIMDGEFLAVLGPSGCGKTTTLNMMAGLDAPTSGRILFDGRDVTHDSPHARNIAMVFQSSLLYPNMTVRRNIEASLRHSDIDAAEKSARVTEAIRLLELEPIVDKLPGQISGGQRQRAATAKAIVRHPAVFLFDEPLSALDAALRLTLRSELVNLQKRLGTTAVFVTHDQVEAMTMGDRIAVMANGRLEQIGTPDEIYNRPSSLFVAGFVGTPPMNLIAGELIEGAFRYGALNTPLPLADAGKATLGIRPQHIAVAAPDEPGVLPATIFAVEHLGRESVVIVEDENRLKLRALVDPGFRGRVGDRLGLRIDVDHVHLFSAEGSRLPLAAREAAG
jgi:ABC-type sugar transport system ATPase subunit